MFPKHIETKAFQHLQVIDHGFSIWWRVKSIWPVPLIQSSEHEDELSIQEWSDNSIHNAFRNGSETCVTSNLVVAHCHC